MGKPESEVETQIIHFSHPHPLQLLNLQTLTQCSACKLGATGRVYTCTTCSFILHPECSQLPQRINHPFDPNPNHAFILYPKPVYPEALFRCDACGKQGAGFSYHCSPCGVDLHTTCAFLPMQVAHQSHHHPLNLSFSSPYPGNSISCDICKMVTSKTWIYRCGACEFDVHLPCVAMVVPTPLTQQNMFVGMQNQKNDVAYSGFNQAGYRAPGLRDQLVVEAVSGVAQSATQGFFGGGGCGVSNVDMMGMGGGSASVDEISYYYDGTDGGYSGGDSSY